MVGNAVSEDEDVVYGLFLSDAGRPWAYFGPNQNALGDEREKGPDAWKAPNLCLQSSTRTTRRRLSKPSEEGDKS